MTVKELIDALNKFPKNTPVLLDCDQEYKPPRIDFIPGDPNDPDPMPLISIKPPRTEYVTVGDLTKKLSRYRKSLEITIFDRDERGVLEHMGELILLPEKDGLAECVAITAGPELT